MRSLAPSSHPHSEYDDYDFSPTDHGRKSISNADIDTDTSVQDPLDDFLPISPASSQPPTPLIVAPEGDLALLDRQTPRDEAHSSPGIPLVSVLIYIDGYLEFNIPMYSRLPTPTTHHNRVPTQFPRSFLTRYGHFTNGS